MKKLLLLGGSSQQIVAIETAKRLGYYTILCDYLPDNPGQYHADKFYSVSTTDKEAVLEIAEKESIDGVIAFASDPAAPTAAYVAENLNLPTNPLKSVEILCNKDRFRGFLADNGFNCPMSIGYCDLHEAKNDIESDKFKFPIIIKPVDSSGSKGVTVLHEKDGLENAIKFAFSFSRSSRIIVEEFIEKKHQYLVGGDIFVNNGKVTIWGLMNCHRDNDVNPLVPVGKSYPANISESDLENVKNTLQNLVDKLGIRFGAMNVELIIDQNDRVFLIDVGPRNGGNMIPDLLGMIFNVDVVELSVRAAMGEILGNGIYHSTPYYATHNLHSSKNGRLKTIHYDEQIERFIVKKCIYKQKGDAVVFFDNASKALGIIFLKFENNTQMLSVLQHINEYIKVEVE